MNQATALDYATLSIAITGAVTGIIALTAQISQFVMAGPRIKVTASNALLTANLRWSLSIDLSNVGRMPVTIIDVGVLVERSSGEPGKMPIAGVDAGYWTGPGLPHRLIDGEAATWFVVPAVVAKGLQEQKARQDVRVYARLATGKLVESRNRINVLNLAQLE